MSGTQTGSEILAAGTNYGAKATSTAWANSNFIKDLETNLSSSGLNAKDAVVIAGVIGGNMPTTGVESLSVMDNVTASTQAWNASSTV